jgi:hypothetical protein
VRSQHVLSPLRERERAATFDPTTSRSDELGESIRERHLWR